VGALEASADVRELTSSEKDNFDYRWTLVSKGLIKRTREFELGFDPGTSTLCFWHDATKYLRDVRNQLLQIEKEGGSEALEKHLDEFLMTAADYVKVFLFKVMISEEAENILEGNSRALDVAFIGFAEVKRSENLEKERLYLSIGTMSKLNYESLDLRRLRNVYLGNVDRFKNECEMYLEVDTYIDQVLEFFLGEYVD
jgi:hypothetical protein